MTYFKCMRVGCDGRKCYAGTIPLKVECHVCGTQMALWIDFTGTKPQGG